MKEGRPGNGEVLTQLRQFLEQYKDRTSFESMLGDFSPEGRVKIMMAFDEASICHLKTPKRKDGRDFITHPASAALIAIFFGERAADKICEQVLHDTGEDSDYWTKRKRSYARRIRVMTRKISEKYGAEVAENVAFATHFTSEDVNGKTHRARRANATKKTHKKFEKGTPDQQRSKMPDRLHNILTIGFVGKNKAKRKIRETEVFYIPLWTKAVNNSPVYKPMLAAMEAAVKEAKRDLVRAS